MPHPARQIGLFLPPTPGYLSDVVMGVQEFARSTNGWVVEVCYTLAIAENSTCVWKPDGILVNASDGDWQPLIKKLGVPTVQIGGQAIPDLPRVVTDNEAIAQMAARHFLQRGFRNFAYLGYGSMGWSRERGQAYIKALADAGYECHTMLAAQGEIHALGVCGPLAAWVKQLPKPVAIFACHDRAAMLAGHACAHVGCEMPDDVAILGVDNNAMECGFTSPPISSIMGSARRIGYQAAELLDRMMRGEAVPHEPQRVAPAGVAARGSTDIYASDDPDLVAALNYIRDHAGEPIEVGDVAKATIVTRRMLERKFRALMNRSPREHILWAHVEQAKSLLINTNLSILDVALRSGFPSSSKFSTVFKRETSLSPMAFRRLYGSVAAVPLKPRNAGERAVGV